MSICNECWGKGWIEKQGVQFDCRKCKGTGVIENEPLTNEEWFCQLPTDEKAKVLETIIIKYLLLKQPKCYEITKREFWELWLKQPHTFK